MIDASICPYCGKSDNTVTYDDDIYFQGSTRRLCEDCGRFYMVKYETKAMEVISSWEWDKHPHYPKQNKLKVGDKG